MSCSSLYEYILVHVDLETRHYPLTKIRVQNHN